jgi:hypothetical protein
MVCYALYALPLMQTVGNVRREVVPGVSLSSASHQEGNANNALKSVKIVRVVNWVYVIFVHLGLV